MEATSVLPLHDEFLEAFGDDALREIAAILAWGHVKALGVGQSLFGQIGEDRCGLLRWMQIDADLLRLDGKYPNIEVGQIENPFGGGKHVEIQAGKFRLMTAHDADPDALVPASMYGLELVRNNTGYLFPELEPLPQASSPNYYAIAFHSKAQTKGTVPGTLEIRFPSGAGGYAVQAIRLYDRYPELRDEGWLVTAAQGWAKPASVAEETIQQTPQPKLRQVGQVGS